MKFVLLATASLLLQSGAAHAAAPVTSAVTRCVSQVWDLPVGADGIVACKGVKNTKDVNAVLECVSQVWDLPIGEKGITACEGK